MGKNLTLLPYRHFAGRDRQGGQCRLHVLDLVAHATGLFVDLLLVHPVAVAILARIMPGSGKMPVLRLSMTIRTGHPIVLDMKVVAEDQLGPLLVTPGNKKRGNHQRNSGESMFHIRHTVHNRTSMDARPR